MMSFLSGAFGAISWGAVSQPELLLRVEIVSGSDIMNGAATGPHAGAMAASSLAVAKQIPLRNHPPVGLSQSVQPSGLGDLSRLFYQSNGETVNKVTRLSSAALVYSVDKSTPSQAERLLRRDEGDILQNIHKARAGRLGTDRSCPHCRLLLRTLYPTKAIPPVVIVNHSARVNVEFSPDTNISQASIKNFQVLVPTSIANEMICLSHPLHWAKLPGTLFKSTSPVNRKGSPDRLFEGSTGQALWEGQAAHGGAFLFEDVVLPVNDTLTAAVENVLCISGFFQSGTSSGPTAGQGAALGYDYCLERCVRSNFGVAWEPSGLDVDGGSYQGRAIPVGSLNADSVDSNGDDQARVPLAHLRERDIQELQAQYRPEVLDDLYDGKPKDARVGWAGALDEVTRVGEMLQDQEGTRYSLVTISASKRLHFSVPEFSPIELWQILTWIAPAFLFTFMNLAVALAPHILLESGKKSVVCPEN
jgi:hypothetical protein